MNYKEILERAYFKQIKIYCGELIKNDSSNRKKRIERACKEMDFLRKKLFEIYNRA